MTCEEMTAAMQCCDEKAWELFHHRYFDWLTTAALARCSSGMDATEIVQLTFLRAVRHIKVIKTEQDLKNWLSCLMRCVIIDFARQSSRRLVLLEKFSHWQESRRMTEHESSSPGSVKLHEALAHLPDDDACLIKLKYLEGWSTRELADRRQTTPKAIESRLTRLRKQLKTLLTKPMEESPS